MVLAGHIREFSFPGDIAAAVLALALAGCDGGAPPQGAETGDPGKGRTVIASVGCGVCHEIPGVPGAAGIVAPSLSAFAGRTLVGGVHVNEPRMLVSFLRDAPRLSPGTGMPAMPITERQALDVAAYLYTLR